MIKCTRCHTLNTDQAECCHVCHEPLKCFEHTRRFLDNLALLLVYTAGLGSIITAIVVLALSFL
ncbi:MAG: hypothetical protein GY861_05785 [bacterium]|nr:hypothetical protein [bacterium]